MDYVFANRIAYLVLRNLIARILCLYILVSAVTGCAFNQPFRIHPPMACEDIDKCPTTILRKYQDFDLAFVEFTERGNVFSRDRMQVVLDHVKLWRKSRKALLRLSLYMDGSTTQARMTETSSAFAGCWRKRRSFAIAVSY